MVEKIFWHDPYLTQLEAKVTAVNENEVTLDKTIFFAFSGGQESDQGTIGGRPVLTAEKQGDEISYTLEAGHGLIPGNQVSIEIDWQRRYRLMRLHFACEITLELVYQAHPGIEKIGAHIAQEKARIDFHHDESLTTLLPELTKRINEIIQADLKIVSDYSNLEKERRYWHIEGFAQVPCGGTHVKHTGEVGAVTLKRKNPGKGKERIEVYVE